MKEALPLRPLISSRRLRRRVAELGAELAGDYRDLCPVVLGILQGSYVFMADLLREIDVPLEIDFAALGSYGGGRSSSGRVRMLLPPSAPLRGRHVLVVEDIVDTGLTTSWFLTWLEGQGPASVRLCALLDKPARRRTPVTIHYLGFTVPDLYLVGYGLDCARRYRNLPCVASLTDAADPAAPPEPPEPPRPGHPPRDPWPGPGRAPGHRR